MRRPMFGRERAPGGMVRASEFAPMEGPATFVDPMQRLSQLEAEHRQFPGSAPNGTGATGLMSSDARGWSDMLQRQQEYVRLNDAVSGGRGVNVRTVADLPSTRTVSQATGRNNAAAFGAPAWVGGQEVEAAMAALKKGARRR